VASKRLERRLTRACTRVAPFDGKAVTDLSRAATDDEMVRISSSILGILAAKLVITTDVMSTMMPDEIFIMIDIGEGTEITEIAPPRVPLYLLTRHSLGRGEYSGFLSTTVRGRVVEVTFELLRTRDGVVPVNFKSFEFD
jgi:hypothetical protein